MFGIKRAEINQSRMSKKIPDIEQKTLMEELEKKREILEAIGVKSAIIDKDYSVLQVTPALQVLFLGEGKKCHEVFGEESNCSCQERPFRDGEPHKKRIIWKDKHFERTSFPVKNKKGEVVMALATFQDISQYVKTEQALSSCEQLLMECLAKKNKRKRK